MNVNIPRFVEIPVAILLVSVSCDGGVASQEPIKIKMGSPPFVLPSNAENANIISQGEGAVQYELNERYPATKAVEEIQKALDAAGWTPLSEDLWNPGLPSSNKVGWRNFIDGTKPKKVRVYQWLGYWRNSSSGAVVMYGLRYEAGDAELNSVPVGDGTGTVEIFTADSLARAGVKLPK